MSTIRLLSLFFNGVFNLALFGLRFVRLALPYFASTHLVYWIPAHNRHPAWCVPPPLSSSEARALHHPADRAASIFLRGLFAHRIYPTASLEADAAVWVFRAIHRYMHALQSFDSSSQPFSSVQFQSLFDFVHLRTHL